MCDMGCIRARAPPLANTRTFYHLSLICFSVCVRGKLIILGEVHRSLLDNSSRAVRTARTKWEDVREKC